MGLASFTTRLARMPMPRLEDIGAAMMAAPNPCGRTFESFMPRFEEDETEPETQH